MPKIFKYKLEPVLRYRQHLEEEKRRALAEARRGVMDQNKVLMGLLLDEGKAKNDLGEMKKLPTLLVGRLRLQEQYINSLARRIRLEYRVLQEKLLAEASARRDLAEARKKVRVLEKLKDRRKADYDYELKRIERKEMDEVGLNVFRRRKRGEA